MANTILVVDDEPLILDTVAEVLSWDGYEVACAADGAAALAAIAKRKPDVLLIDLMMPIKDGHATIRELRARADTEALPIVLMTAAPQADSEQLYDALLVKPFRVAELRLALAAAVAARRR